MRNKKNIFNLVFLLLLGAPRLTHASFSKAGAEKAKAATFAAAASAATATAAVSSVGSATAQKSCNQATLDARLVEYAKRADIIGVQQQLAQGANPDAQTREGKSVLDQTLDDRLQKNPRKHGKRKNIRKEYEAVAIMLVRAGARLRYNHFDGDEKARDWLITCDIYMPKKVSSILYGRLYKAVKEVSVTDVRKQLERGAYPYGQDRVAEPVLYTAIDGWLQNKQGKGKEYCEITIELMKAHAELFCYCERPYKRPDVRLAYLPHVVDGVPVVYKQALYDAQGKPGWLHKFFAKALHAIIHVSSIEGEEGNKKPERNLAVEHAMTRCVRAILNAGFDITIEVRHCNSPYENIYALMNSPFDFSYFMRSVSGPEKWPKDGMGARENSLAIVKGAYDTFFRDHQKIVREGLEQAALPSPLFDFIYECLYIRPYGDASGKMPLYIKELLAGNKNAVVCDKAIQRYMRIGGFIPYTEELNNLAQKQGSAAVQQVFDDNAPHQRTLKLHGAALHQAIGDFELATNANFPTRLYKTYGSSIFEE